MSVSPYRLQNEAIAKILADIAPPVALSVLPSLPESLLQTLCPHGTISSSACEQIMKFSEKEMKVQEKCDLSRVKVRPDDGRIYLVVKRKPVSSTSYPGLIDKLYEHFYGIQTSTLESFFEVWMEWRKNESSASDKTIRENRFLWNALLKDQEITRIPMQELKVQDYIAYFRSITKDRKLTRKRFNDLKSILNNMLYLAVEKEILSCNCLRDINYKQFSYKAEDTETRPYTEEERQRIIEHLSKKPDDFYSLAILLDFHLVLRIGELKGLKWSDIAGNSIHIQRFVNDKNKIIEDIKGHAREGRRIMPLTATAQMVLQRLKALNPDSEYILIRNGQPLSTCTFNRHLKKCCEELGIEYRSSHKLRFSTASIMYKNGLPLPALQKYLGHSNLSMTQHYIRDVASEEENAEKMRAILG